MPPTVDIPNGDFSQQVGDLSSAIGPDNPMNGWTGTQTVGSGTIEAFQVADATTGAGYRVDFIITGSSPTDEYIWEADLLKSVATIGQSSAFIGRYNVDETAAGGPSSTLELQFLDSADADTGSAGTVQNGDAQGARPDGGTAPADAARLRVRVIISGSEGDGTVSLYRVYLDAGNTGVVVADLTDPAEPPATFSQALGVMAVLNGAGEGVSAGAELTIGGVGVPAVGVSLPLSVAGFIHLTAQSDPGTPATGNLVLYAKTSGGVARLFYKDDGGTVRGPL